VQEQSHTCIGYEGGELKVGGTFYSSYTNLIGLIPDGPQSDQNVEVGFQHSCFLNSSIWLTGGYITNLLVAIL
jgi:hypothetical protein